jgi:hypothetical protein
MSTFGSFGSIVEVAIGLVFVFALTALMVTQINTLIGNLLKLRARHLYGAIMLLITDKQLRADILAHPLIQMIPRENGTINKESATGLAVSAQTVKNVSEQKVFVNPNITYIAPANFVEALMSALISRSDIDIYQHLQNGIAALQDPAKKQQLDELLKNLQMDLNQDRMDDLEKRIIELLPDDSDLKKAISNLRGLLETVRYKYSDLIPLLDGVNKLQNSAFREMLKIILASAKDIDDARRKLETWFNDGMSRTSEAFKRNITTISLIVSLLIAVFLNVDALYLGRILWENPTLRQNVVNAAERYDLARDREAGTAQSITPSAETSINEGDDITLEQLGQNASDIRVTAQDILELQLPIGWENTVITPDMVLLSQELGLTDPRDNPRNLWNLFNSPSLLFQKILGILVTTLAAAQGAPFWFDLLTRLRGGGGSAKPA